MKKFFSLVLALVMALSLTTVAWGANVATEADLPATLADGDTLTLTADVPLSATWAVAVDGSAVLDLGGKTLTGRINLTKGELTIKNGTINGAGGQALNVYGSATAAQNYSVLNVEATVKVTNFSHGIVVFGPSATSKDANGAVVNLKGTLEGTGTGVFVSGNVGNSNSAVATNNVVNIYGTINTSGQGVAMCGAATVNVYDGASITGSEAIGVKRGTLNVYGGSLIATGAYVDPAVANTNGTEATGAAISVTSTYNDAGSIDINVEGGTIQSMNGVALYVGHSANSGTATAFTNGADIDVSAGNFIGAEADVYVAPAITGDSTTYPEKFISGGEFSAAVPAEYVVSGKAPVVENGTFTVGTAPAASGTTGNNSFSSSTTSGVTTSVSAAEKYALYDAFTTTKVTGWTVKSYTTMATKTVTSNGVTTTSYIPAYYTLTDGTDTVKLYEADANSGLFRIFKGDQFVTYVNPLFDALSTGGYVEGDYIADSAAYIAKDKGCGTYGEDVYKINNNKAYAVDPYGRFVAIINGKVAVYDGASVSVPHTFTDEVTYKSTTDLTVVAIECDKCEKSFQVVKTSKLPATYKGATANLTFGGNNYYILLETATTVPGAVVGTPSTGNTVTSAQTFDAGIAMYVGMSIMAAAGSAVVIGKKKD